MSFRIMARTILELGAELISSDGVALYELIKNSIDAGSRKVEIGVHVPVTRSQFEELKGRLEPEATGRRIREQARVALRLPRLAAIDASISADLLTRLDAEGTMAAVQAWYDHHSFIRVKDTGDGMSLGDLEQIYLTIGTRSRHRERIALQRLGGAGRAPLGEKGVGRLSTMRLGDLLEVRTTRAGETNINVFDVDWGLFSHESDAMLHEVEIVPRIGVRKARAQTKGTQVRIRRLKSDWSADKLGEIAGRQFSRLVDPFEGQTANDIIRLSFNGDPVDIPEIDRRYLDLAHGTCAGRFEVNGANLAFTAPRNIGCAGSASPSASTPPNCCRSPARHR